MAAITKAYKVSLSTTTVHALLTGSNRVGPPSWKKLSSLIRACHEALQATGVDSAGLGSLDSWYQRYLDCVSAGTYAERDGPGRRLQLSGGDRLTSLGAEPEVPVRSPPASLIPLSLEALYEHASPNLLLYAKAASLVVRRKTSAAPHPHDADTAAHEASVASAEPAPAEPTELAESAEPASVEPVCGCPLNHPPAQCTRSAKAWPSYQSLRSASLPPAPPLWLPAQPVEKDAYQAVLRQAPPVYNSHEHVRGLFGSRGVQLLEGIEAGNAMDAFELGVLLVNHMFIFKGSKLMNTASRLEGRLALDFPGLRVGDKLYGKIVKDIYRRVAAGYDSDGHRESAATWSQRAAEIDGDAPIAVLLAPSTGRHARTHDRHLPFGALQVQRLESFYWRFYAPDPADPSRYTARDRSMLNAMVTDQSAGTSAPAMKPTQGRHSTTPRLPRTVPQLAQPAATTAQASSYTAAPQPQPSLQVAAPTAEHVGSGG
ncbi:hypothetical protein [Streptosporangium canum]|uniref:hypothetical protein n=1 Tax=Streptosporangium canum TaxID=324952 RepID=UPI0037A441EF